MKPTLVTAAIIRNNDRILIAQRKNTSFLEPNKWEFPGGKIEKGEHAESCLRREIQEELGVDICIEKLFAIHSHTYVKEEKKYPIVLIVYMGTITTGNVQPLDCQRVEWVLFHDLKNYEFVKGDLSILTMLSHEYSKVSL